MVGRELYLPTLTLSTEADFHRGRVTRKLQIKVEKKLQNSMNKNR